VNNDRACPMRRHGAAVTAAAAGAAGGPPAAVAVALATFGRPGLAAIIGLLSMATASLGAAASGPVGATLARGYVERQLLRTATAEARRTDDDCAAVAVALIAAVDRGPERADATPDAAEGA
jgi:hypothetical protein